MPIALISAQSPLTLSVSALHQEQHQELPLKQPLGLGPWGGLGSALHHLSLCHPFLCCREKDVPTPRARPHPLPFLAYPSSSLFFHHSRKVACPCLGAYQRLTSDPMISPGCSP
jgi:hypothetical protein